MFGDGPFVLLDDAREGRSDCGTAATRLYRDPMEVVEANSLEELEACLPIISAAKARGLHAAGYMSYEAGLALEGRLLDRLPAVRHTPLLWFGLFNKYRQLQPSTMLGELPDPKGAWLGALKPGVTRKNYDAAFDRVKDYIIAGDIYQANLTFRASARYAGHPLALYAAIRERAKAGYGGVVFDGRNWMLSFSPELFFAVKDRRITAKPMKGTAARAIDEHADAAVRAELQNDPKQRAENLMIVDLLRNDLSRVAERGSVKVPKLFQIESYPTIHQMTSTVTAKLANDRDAVDILRQIFPCGSITGAPKIRAMEIIEELEPDQRGIYCGSIGRIDAPKENGFADAAFNVAIRTFFIEEGKETLSIGLGSGIVADSNRDDEWRECLAKGEFAKVVTDFDLVEAMAFDPHEGIALLERHLERMKASAQALDFEFDRHRVRNALQAVTFHQEELAKVRLMLARSGEIAIEVQPLGPAPGDHVMRVKTAALPLDSLDVRLRHKTSDRRHLDAALKAEPDSDQVIFVDDEGFLTESNAANIFVERDGLYLTPPASRGLLPGVLRAALLASGEANEVDLRVSDLEKGFMLGNSVRGLMEAEIVI